MATVSANDARLARLKAKVQEAYLALFRVRDNLHAALDAEADKAFVADLRDARGWANTIARELDAVIEEACK